MAVERISDLEVRLTMPATEEDVVQLKIGDHVLVSGVIYTARDAAHSRMIAALNAGKKLPIDIEGQLIYYVGPTPARPGHASGSFGRRRRCASTRLRRRCWKPASKYAWARAIAVPRCRKR